MTQSFPQFSF